MQKNIGVLGCGWLGLPLAKTLVENGYKVGGTTTTPEKLTFLADSQIEPYLCNLSKPELFEALQPFFESEILVVNIPPKRGAQVPYSRQIEKLIPLIRQGQTQKVLFVSSTSVYQPSEKVITENSALDEENARELIKAEELIKAPENPWQTTVVRFAGLFGPNRAPGRFLAGRTNLPDASSPVNLIHLADCIHIIQEIIRQEKWGEIFNACAPEHPSRKEFYVAAAQASGLPLPVFAPEGDTIGKQKLISCQKLTTALDYTFLFPDPMLALFQE